MTYPRPFALALILAAAAIIGSSPVTIAQPSASAAEMPQATALTPESASVKPILGTWIYAKDPTGAVPFEALYDGSTITFGPDATYTFQLGQTTIALKGTWEARGAEKDTVRVHTEYGQGRSNDLTLKLRRDSRGATVGMEVREGDGSTGARYYSRFLPALLR